MTRVNNNEGAQIKRQNKSARFIVRVERHGRRYEWMLVWKLTLSVLIWSITVATIQCSFLLSDVITVILTNTVSVKETVCIGVRLN